MNDESPRLNLPFILPAQAQKHVTHNTALERLDLLVQLTVAAFGASNPPTAVQEGQVWALGPAPTGGWAGQANRLAVWQGGGWMFAEPQPGWRAALGSDLRVWDGSAWVQPALAEISGVTGVGVNTGFDATNRLSVSSDAALFSHDGAGHQLKVNKAGPGDTASLMFQTGWSGRAEMGLAGTDNFSIKVSADGISWLDGLALDQVNGMVSVPNGLQVSGAITGTGARNLPALLSASSDTGTETTNDMAALITAANCRADGARSLVAASDNCHAEGNRSAVMASSACKAAGLYSFIAASQDSNATDIRSAVVASQDSDVDSPRSAVIASDDGLANSPESAVIASFQSSTGGASKNAVIGSSACEASANSGSVIAARRVINNANRSLAMGNSNTGDPLTANRTIHLFSDSGNIAIAGSLTSSHSFADFAEMFANATGAEIPLGTIVTEEGGAVRPAGPGDEIAGVVTATAVVTAGDTPFAWQGRYLSDEWGRPVMQEIPDPDHEGNDPAPMIQARVENPDWNPDAPQVPRSERPDQWTRVGLLGQVFTRVAEGVSPGDRLSADDGIGVKSTERTGLRCMTITQAYDANQGYAVARCLVCIAV